MLEKTLMLGVSLLASTALADAPGRSQHARAGEVAEIQFSSGSARLPVTASQSIGEIAGWASENPMGLVVLDAHADGAPKPATTLALHRAESVRDQLIVLGVDTEHIVIAAFADEGSGKPETNPRVRVWLTRQPLAAVVAARGNAAAVVWGQGLSEPRPQVAGR